MTARQLCGNIFVSIFQRTIVWLIFELCPGDTCPRARKFLLSRQAANFTFFRRQCKGTKFSKPFQIISPKKHAKKHAVNFGVKKWYRWQFSHEHYPMMEIKNYYIYVIYIIKYYTLFFFPAITLLPNKLPSAICHL